MNERYICRGKRKDNDEWIEGYLIQGNKTYIATTEAINYMVVSTSYMASIELVEVIPETVGQCTTLTDKNGKPIFKGDIVESRASENQEDWKKWVVGFSDGSFCFNREISKKRKHKHEENLLCVDEIELYGLTVIGNIHDNPELLEMER